MCPVLHWCILFFWIPWTLFCLSCPFFSLMCNFNVANSKKILTEKHDIFFVTNPNIKDQDLHLSRKFFYFIFVIMQSICMEQCHSHLQCGYILIPIKKKPLNALGLVRSTKTSVHKIVNVCLQYLSSLFYKNGVNSATIYPIIYNPPSYPLMKCWSSDSYHDEKWMIGYFWKLFSPEINVRMTNLAQFCQIWVILSTLWLLILLKKEQSVQWLKSKPKTY